MNIRDGHIIGLGDVFNFSTEAATQWLEQEGRAFKAAKRPKGVRKGRKGNCYSNATRLIYENQLFGDKTLQYAEGVATLDGSPFMVWHGWVVTPDGTVIDPTLKHPEQYTYFGVQCDWDWYKKHVGTTGFYGVLGGDPKAGAEFLQSKGINPRAIDPRFSEMLARMA